MLLHMMRNSNMSETKLVDAAVQDIRRRLPPQWTLRDYGRDLNENSPRNSGRIVDAILQIRDSQGLSASIVVEVRTRPVEPRLVSYIAEMLRRMTDLGGREDAKPGTAPVPLLVSSFLSPLTRERLVAAGMSYADSTGNIRFSVDRPAVFIETQGADRNPFREDRRLRSLKGSSAARVVRALLDYRAPFGTRELAGEIGSSPATISRVSGLLEREAIISREGPRGRIVSVDWETLARRWAMDYDLVTSNVPTTWIEPRGTGVLFERLPNANFQYAVTGSFAATRLAPVAEPRLVTIYAEDPEAAGGQLRLRPAETGGNVLILRPFDPVVFERAQCADGITYTRVTQVLADLMKGPGRGPAEAEGLLEWMRDNEDIWKLPMTGAA